MTIVRVEDLVFVSKHVDGEWVTKVEVLGQELQASNLNLAISARDAEEKAWRALLNAQFSATSKKKGVNRVRWNFY